MKYKLIASAALLAAGAAAACVGTASAQSTAPATTALAGASRRGPSNSALALQIDGLDEGKTTTKRLEAAQTYLTRVVAALDLTPNDLSDGHAAKAKAAAKQTLDDIKAALAYVHDHPEIDPLHPSQHPLPGTGNTRPGNVPDYARYALSSTNKAISVNVGIGKATHTVAYGPMDAHGIRIDQDGKGVSVYLGCAMQDLVNGWRLFTDPPGLLASGMTDIGGFRDKIWDGMTKTSAESLAGLDFIHEHTTGTPVTPANTGLGASATSAAEASQLASASPPVAQPQTDDDTWGPQQRREAAPAQLTRSAAALEATRKDLQKALDLMQKTSAANKGGFVEQSVADLQKALADTTDAMDYAKTHPDPTTPSLTEDVVLDERSLVGGLPAPGPRAALKNLESAAADVQGMPGSDPGGYRSKIMADIAQAAADTISSITFAGTPQPGRNGRNGRGQAPAAKDLSGGDSGNGLP